MKIHIILFGLVLCLPLMAADKETPTQTEIIEAAIRKSLKKPEGELTKADLEKVTGLRLERSSKQFTASNLNPTVSLKYTHAL